ncbi:Pimeloyl-ACP methyl ester carboxylesterase [Neorhodopirellula lusitana]|uniref:Pimeloyl-ACP methyl ester carboxylesterase n=1 Tax=Neorhodopirellula lusitana TaxID=445327 RepID=A0ABY1QL84_9BACT|nr:alpha/beta hydrolase [Neorhodopirellula lusitana]SMP72533.1 Pimeloyl-ACP methyl ester carboxylesterase [Neorhodopirellula lusitana]
MTMIPTRDGHGLYVKNWGSGRPVVLIHGWPLSADSWDYHAMQIADAGFRVVAYDRRGFGRSDQPFGDYDYDSLSDDLSDVMTAMEVKDASIIGFSMGGGEVARYMSRHAGRHVQQCGLISSVVPYMLKTNDNPNGVDQSVFDGMSEALLADRPKFFADFFKDFFGVGLMSHPVSEEYLHWTRSVAMQASLKATLACANSFATTDFRPDLAAVNVPTLVVHGTADATVPIDASGRPAAKAIKSSTLKEYDGAPHGLFATHRDQLLEDLLEFLRS